MALTKFNTDVENIQALSDKPNEIEGLTADQLKKKFDDAGIDIKQYVNETLTAEQDVINTSLDSRLDTAETEIDALQTGWKTISATLTYSSADSPTFVVGTSVDLTGSLSLGMKIKLTQSTVKYFFITAIDATTITLYGGTDYTLANSAITAPSYSTEKAPFGFPLEEDKWSVVATDTSSRTQASPVAGTWYNLGGVSFTVPIGYFNVSYSCVIAATRASAGLCGAFVTLATVNNNVTDAEFNRLSEGNALIQTGGSSVMASKKLALTSKTTFYINTRASTSGLSAIFNSNNNQTLVLKATIAYL